MKNLMSLLSHFNRIRAVLCVLCVISVSSIASQNTNRVLELEPEVPDDPYVYVNKSSMPTQAAYRNAQGAFFTNQVNIDASGNDIIGDAGNEPSIAVDPTNPDRIVIGWRQFDNIASNFRQAGNAYSLDGGQTWVNPEPLDAGVFRSDPVLDFDANGNFYYNSLQSNFSCDVYKITDGGQDWGAPFPARGGDKQWMRIDRTGGIGDGHNYSYWNSSFTTCEPGSFTRSTNGSNNFETCLEIDGDPRWGTLAVGDDGTLYMSGVSNTTGEIIVVQSSTAKDPNADVTWDTLAQANLDGFLNVGVPLNPSGLWGQCWVDVDISGGPGNGNVYVCASVARNSGTDPADVMFTRSTDGGMTFEPPIKINKDSVGNYNWFGVMSVAPNGRIDVIWLDTRNADGGINSELFYSSSIDQGTTWSEDVSISLPFDPTIGYPNQSKMGDYYDMVSTNDGAHLAWTSTINGGQDVYYSFIPPSILDVETFSIAQDLELKIVPNPFSEETTISFNASPNEKVTVEVFNIHGQKVNTLVNEEIFTETQTIQWDTTNGSGSKLASGIYFISLQSGADRSTIKAVKL